MKLKHFTLTLMMLITSTVTYGQTQSNQETFEGYYQIGWESSAFYEQKGDNIYKPIWLEFDPSFERSDSLTELLTSDIVRKGVFMRCEGIRAIGGSYGHLGASAEKVTVSRILFIDPTRTIDNFPFKRNDSNN